MRRQLLNKLTALVLAAVLTLGYAGLPVNSVYADMCGGLEEEDVYVPDSSDIIQDPILHWAVRSALGAIKDKSLILTPELVASKTVDSIIYEQGSHPEDFTEWTGRHLVKSLEGLQYATAASHIDISYSDGVEGNEIEDLSPLSGLTQLTKLKLYMDGITDISSLAGLVNMREMSVRSNDIQDISAVKDMKKLTNLDFGYNKVTDVSAVSGLTSLKYLDMCNNQIASLPDLSELKYLESLNVSNNKLTNTDVETVSHLTTLQVLDLSGNSEITDLKPLVELVNLSKEKTILPVSADVKDDLFAAIKVNSEFQEFNISKMASDDLDYVKIALDNYDALTDNQKSYLDSAMIEAAKSNYAKVSAGGDPEYYEEYDRGGVQKPVWNRVDISVVDNNGHPLKDVKIIRAGLGEIDYTTDDSGKVSIPHSSWDSDKEFTVTVDADGYVCKPASIVYEVKDHKTYVVNGKRATGLEKLQFVLTPDADYVDKTALEEAIKKSRNADDEYKYTDSTYSAFEKALKTAEAALESAETNQATADKAAADLNDAFEALEYKHVLTTLKINVRDKNGNLFVRAFKFQVDPNGDTKTAWNIYSDKDNEISTGVAIQPALPTWKEGTEYIIKACNHEAYDLDKPIKAVVAKAKDGTLYFSKVNGVAVDYTYEIDVKAIPRANGARDKSHEIFPDGSRLSAYIKKAQNYSDKDYTPASFEKLTQAMESAEAIMSKSATQEEYNQAGADIVAAAKNLVPIADTLALERAVNLYFSKDGYTTSSWDHYQTELESARALLDNINATQAEVDNATDQLKHAQSALVLRGDKANLEKKLSEAEKIKKEDCELGYNDLLEAIQVAHETIDFIDSTDEDVADAEKRLADAVDAIVLNPVESEWDCLPGTFRAKVIDTNGDSVSGVPFKVVSNGEVVNLKNAISNEEGIIAFDVDDLDRNVETVITIDGEEYNCTDKHSIVVTGFGAWFSTISTIDGQSFNGAAGTYITYTVTVATKSINNASVKIDFGSETFETTGEPVAPDVIITDGDTVLEEGVDYEIKFDNNQEIGLAEATISGIGSYRACAVRHFRLVEPKKATDENPEPGADENPEPGADEDPKPAVVGESKRIYGDTRIETAINIAEELKTTANIEKFENIIVASGQSFPDALAGSYLASKKSAPIVLVDTKFEDKVSQYIKNNIADNGVVYILGGELAVSKRFEQRLKSLKVVRLGGSDRYETNIKILKAAGISDEKLLICTGTGYADSLSASATRKPIFIVGKKLTEAQKKFLSELKTKETITIGGTKVVSESVVNSVIKAIPAHPKNVRAAGPTRYETSIAVAEALSGDEITTVVLTYGKNFPDGLSGGPIAMLLNAPMILVTDEYSSQAKKFCREHNIKQVIVLGGPKLISEGTFNSMISE